MQIFLKTLQQMKLFGLAVRKGHRLLCNVQIIDLFTHIFVVSVLVVAPFVNKLPNLNSKIIHPA